MSSSRYTPETLSQKRCRFTAMLARLIDHATSLGYGIAIDQAKRTQAEAAANAVSGKGISNSLHIVGLAVDFNLYDSTGRYLTETSDHQPLGLFWESLSPDARWGGRFRDGNHYSLEHNGIR